ncbi:hypothetical protein [Paenibacillus pabuli]|uniref:hypothetical protein n=1 Tax=Paenibacillus pabuli TaxID=1472 RepID=UPI0020004369|nr:hypothetical protein [Paenibacillus pabuli]UPK45890.1 hypothetical protein KET34_10740 [Paenibacillus pabuli]
MAISDDEKPVKKAASKEPVSTFDKVQKPESWSYLGPTILGGKLRKGVTYTSGFPEFARAVYDQNYEVRKLLVPLSGMLEVYKELFDPNSESSTCYRWIEGSGL